MLRESPFRVGHLAYVHTSEAPVDYIVAQTPLANIEGQMGDSIDLLVSLGPYKKVMVMPDLVQEQLSYGIQAIGKLGLVLGKVERDPEYPIPLPPDTIISQLPKPGTLVEEQNLVNLVVTGAAATDFNLPAPSLSLAYQTVEYAVPIGSFDREVMVMVRNAEGVSEVFRQRVESGRQLLLQIPVIGETVMEIYLDGILDDVRRIEARRIESP
jgi:serine/threonine-protein kinase